MKTLDSETVDIVIERMATIYGAAFARVYRAGDLANIRTIWAHELREFADKPEAIDYALNNLPTGNVPNVLEIRDIARRRPGGTTFTGSPRDPPVTAEEKARALAILKAFERPEREDPKQWARRLRYRELCGERLTQFQRACWREALRYESIPDSNAETKPVVNQQVSNG